MAVKWVDRVPTNPNRMKITPENGSVFYAKVERADNPTVPGTPVNAANLNAMQDAVALAAHKTVYVSKAGSDSGGNGTQANPYATITKALSVFPKNLNGFSATVNVAAGIYNENVTIQHFGNGNLAITGVSGASVTVNSMLVDNVKTLEVNNVALNLSGGFLHLIGSGVRVLSPFSASGAQYGVYASYFSEAVFTNTVTINNTTANAVISTNCSSVYIQKLAGTGNNVALASTRGAVCSFGINESTSEILYYVVDGGRILAGAQTSTPNY